jgi:hypothetical protein
MCFRQTIGGSYGPCLCQSSILTFGHPSLFSNGTSNHAWSMLSSLWGENLLQRHYSLLTMSASMVPLLGNVTVRVFNDRWECWEINQMEVQMCCPLIGQIGSMNFFLVFSLYWYIWSQAANRKLVSPKLVILPLQFVNAIACHILPIVELTYC